MMDIKRSISKQVEAKLQRYHECLKQKVCSVLDEQEKEIVMEMSKPEFNVIINGSGQKNIKQRCRALVTSERRQCSRYETENGLCRTHNLKAPYGTIDNPVIKQQRKRKDPFKRKEISSTDEIDISKYIETSLFEINGKEYLICMKTGLVFTNGRRSDIVDILSSEDLDKLKTY